MASMKAEKHVGTQLFGQVRKEAAAKTGDGASKTKVALKKAAPKTTPEPKKKAKGGKAAAKH